MDTRNITPCPKHENPLTSKLHHLSNEFVFIFSFVFDRQFVVKPLVEQSVLAFACELYAEKGERLLRSGVVKL